MEQRGKREETQGIHNRVDKLFSLCGHENANGRNGQMAAPPNPGGVLETMEEGAHKVQNVASASFAGMEST